MHQAEQEIYEDHEESIHISDYLDMLYKRKTLISLIFILIVSVTVLYTLRAIPIYQSTATMIIDQEKYASPLTGQRMEFESIYSQEMTFNTHFKLILSKAVIQRVIQALNFGAETGQSNSKELEISSLKKQIKQYKENLKLLLHIEEKTPPTPNERFNSLVNAVKSKVTVAEVAETRLLKISVKDRDPEQAAKIANVLAKQYIEFNLSNRMEATKNTLDWMNNELYHLKKKLEDAERAFFDFKQSKKVFSLKSKQMMVDQKLSEFNSNYLDTRNNRLDLDTKIREIEKNFKINRDLANVRSLISNPTIETVYTTVKNLEIQYANLTKVYKSKHPKIIQVREELSKNITRLDNELEKELTSLKSKRTVLYSREQVLKDTIEEFEQDALNTSGNELEYSILQRNLNTSKHLYNTLLSKMKESDLLKTSDSSHIRLVEEAIIPVNPVSPDTKRNIMLGIILGLAAGTGVAFFLEYMDQTIRTDEDVQRHLNSPLLSVIPKVDKNKSLLFDLESGTRYAESFRTFRTNLGFSSMDREVRSLLITSSVESEGKTNTAINLGYTIAQSGSRVLLVDADLRRPRLTGLFSLKKEKGFTDIISATLGERVSKGNLEDYSIGDLLILIKLQKRTGELNIESNGNRVAIYFTGGKVVDVYWKNRPESKKLANTLIRKNILTKEEASLALDHQKKSIQRLGTILFSMGLVSKEKLTKELTFHTVEVMRLISTMVAGTFHFNTQSTDEIKSPVSQNTNFEKLFKEFSGQGEQLLSINSAIDAVIYPTKTENVFVLPSGKLPHNPSELIGSNGTTFLMGLLRKKFDFIILDTPPVLPATDAMLMAPRTDGTILVVKSGNTERKIIKEVVESFKNAQLPILGTILNFVDLKKEGYYRYYKKYYSSYYGD